MPEGRVAGDSQLHALVKAVALGRIVHPANALGDLGLAIGTKAVPFRMLVIGLPLSDPVAILGARHAARASELALRRDGGAGEDNRVHRGEVQRLARHTVGEHRLSGRSGCTSRGGAAPNSTWGSCCRSRTGRGRRSRAVERNASEVEVHHPATDVGGGDNAVADATLEEVIQRVVAELTEDVVETSAQIGVADATEGGLMVETVEERGRSVTSLGVHAPEVRDDGLGDSPMHEEHIDLTQKLLDAGTRLVTRVGERRLDALQRGEGSKAVVAAVGLTDGTRQNSDNVLVGADVSSVDLGSAGRGQGIHKALL